MQETRVWSLGGEDPLKKEMATHSSILAWENPMDREAWQATVQGVAKGWTWLSGWITTTALLLYNAVLASAVPQIESALYIHISPLSLASLPHTPIAFI